MKKINAHGLKINLESLMATARETENLPRDLYQVISFDRETGDVVYWCGMHDNWPEYRDPAVMYCFSTRRHCSAQHIADEIHAAMAHDRHITVKAGDRYEYDSIWE